MAENTRERVSAKTLNVESLRNIITAMFGAAPNANSEDAGGRFAGLFQKIERREQHYHNMPQADPPLAPPYDKGDKFQTDIIRRTNVKLLARQTENKAIFKVDPGSSKETAKKDADNYEQVLNLMFDVAQERQRLNIQRDLHHSANTLCYGVLHWLVKPDHMPGVPDYEYSDTPGDGKKFRDYAESNDAEEDAAEGDTPKYKETDTSVQERYKRAKAEAGAPVYFEVIHPKQFAFMEDRSCYNGMGMALVRRRIPLLDLNRKLREEKVYLSLNDQDNRVTVFEEKDAPEPNTALSDIMAWGKYVYLTEVWTREEYYEVVTGNENSADSEILKSFPHPYEMPPFALAIGHENPHPEPAYKYEPLLTGLYRVKPYYDRARALADVISEMIALPMWYIELPNGQMYTESGKPLYLTRNALAAQVMPPGGKLIKVEYSLNPAVNEWINSLREELESAAPSTGATEISAGTEPWAIRLQQAEANIEVKPSVDNVAQALRTMARNISMVFTKPASEGGIGEEIVIYGKTRSKDGREILDKDNLISFDPNKIPSLKIDVVIDAHSSAERITMQQHGLDLVSNSHSLTTRRDYAENYEGRLDATKAIMEKDAEMLWLERIRPQVVEQELAKTYETFIVVGANGRFVGMGGQEMTPEQVLQRFSEYGAPPPIELPPQPGPTMSAPMSPELTQDPMPYTGGPLQVPGTVPVPPMVQ